MSASEPLSGPTTRPSTRCAFRGSPFGIAVRVSLRLVSLKPLLHLIRERIIGMFRSPPSDEHDQLITQISNSRGISRSTPLLQISHLVIYREAERVVYLRVGEACLRAI